jgi:hypothetical protein
MAYVKLNRGVDQGGFRRGRQGAAVLSAAAVLLPKSFAIEGLSNHATARIDYNAAFLSRLAL